MIRAKINGIEGEFAEGASVLEAARKMGSGIPTLCDDKRLDPVGACRMCLVEIKGRSHATVSCTTILADGMEIETHTEPIEWARKWNLRMLARNYPADAFTKYPDKPFHKLTTDYGLTAADFHGDHSIAADPSHTYIDVDMSRCINCYACARICADVQGQFVWHVLGRGEDSHIMPDSFGAFGDSTCVSCGACADACPTGALEDKTVIERGFPTEWTKTTCPYCGTGCEMNVGTRDDRVVQVKPVMDAPVNYGHLCVKGRYAFDFIDADDRVTEPMIREGGDWRVVSWEEAIQYTADKLKAIDAEFGKESIAVLGSARATNEENYLAQKFTRVVLGTNNVDCCARVCHTPSAAAMKMMIGTGAMTNSFDDIEKARTIILCGANPSENHPIPGARIKQAVIKNGTKLIVIDPRKTELTKYADVHLQLRPGTNILMFNAIAHAIIDEGLTDPEFIATRVEEFEEFKSFVAEYSPEAVAERCGVDAELIRKAARIYATVTPSMAMHGLGMTEHLQGTEGVMTIVNLALLTGNIGKAGAGVNPLRGQNNVQGSAHMGCDPGILTGSITIEAGRELFESVWKTPIPTAAGLNQLQMIDAARDGKLKALWTIGYDVFLSNANAHETAKAFVNMDLVIIQDFFMNETAKRFGHVFFPAVTSFEKDGTFMNGERRVQRIRGAVSPRGNSRSDWEIVCDLAAAMGFEKDFAFNSAEEIWNEVRAVWPPGYGITYERIEKAGIQWPCPDIDHPGTEILHGESFSNGVKAALRRIKFRATKEAVSEDFPFLLTTGRVLEHFNAGTMTMRTPNHELRPTDLLMVSKADSARLSIASGEKVRLRSNYGEAVLPVEITDKVKTGELFASFHDPAVFLNYATGPTRDRFTQAPEFKVTAVCIEKLDSQISSN
ncbi:MAG: formate dehydrogenase subunit alpha [Pyrinomonadaceae bacterium]|nr:formate dehydrogenase subunit alpha [Pyrinomonadaceae bacterium]